MQTEKAFLATKYWPQLDGLRTVSITLVLIVHMGDKWLPPIKGALGVVLFFVISGFLITSLLIREERREGRVSISDFYIRRAFRIAPMYYLALAVASALVLIAGLGSGNDSYLGRLPLLATFNGDFAIYGTFVHAWSLGIEEKFYIFWPLVGFAILALRKHRGLIVGILLTVCAIAAYVPGASYFGIYTAILAGCAVAIAMHTPAGYAAMSKLGSTLIAATLLTLASVVFVLDQHIPGAEASGLSHVPFALAVALVFPSLVAGRGMLQKVLSWRPLVFIGTRTYGIYLFHPFCIDVINRFIPDGQTAAIPAIVRLIAAAILSFVVADVLYRLVEKPLTDVGRRITKARKERRQPVEANA